MADIFPYKVGLDDKETNVASKLFGHRFFGDQGKVELLSEFLLICISKKDIKEEDHRHLCDIPFPSIDNLEAIEEIKYKPKYNVLLKLFALYDHKTGGTEVRGFEDAYNSIINREKSKIQNMNGNAEDKEKRAKVSILQSLYKGFQEVGKNRDWCAQSFLPISDALLADESIWKRKNNAISDKEGAIRALDHNSRLFYARGGEVIYLQLLSALNHTKTDVEKWLKDESNPFKDMNLSDDEKDPAKLKDCLNNAFNNIYKNKSPEFFNTYVKGLKLDGYKDEEGEKKVGFIPSRTWGYGYVFAVELSRFFRSSFDIVETMNHLESACVLQEIRTMLGESANDQKKRYPLLPVVSPTCRNLIHKMVSNDAFKYCQQIIKDALDNEAEEERKKDLKDHKFKSTDYVRYGHKLFQKIAKSIEFVLPPKGNLEHFVLTKDLITYIVSTTLVPDGLVLPFDTFLNDIKIRYGIVLDSDGFTEANMMMGKKQDINEAGISDWFIQMLEECDYYVRLSDSLSLVKNTNVKGM